MSNLVIRQAGENDAQALWSLIHSHQREGHLLPRELSEIRRHSSRFLVAEISGAGKEGQKEGAVAELVACAELAPLSDRVAEVRSMVVNSKVRRVGLASRMVNEIRQKAASMGFETLCAFTHDARFFVRQNFSIVPHTWLPAKIATDCVSCPLFRSCGQHAMMLPLVDIPMYAPSPAASATPVAARAAVA
jgi:amino-acid N-acetyltransferase